jgi:uncharacterized protein involved in exopolysaccharide biosynthesis
MHESQILPAEILKRTLSKWWVVVFFALLGGGLGVVVFLLQPTLYQADAEISVNIDYTQSGALTDLQVDQVMDTVGDVLQSDSIQESILNALAEQNSPLGDEEISHWLWVERAGFRFLIRVRSTDPQVAETVAALYASTSVVLLNEALEHAIVARELERHLLLLEGCMQAMVAVPSEGSCAHLSLAELQIEISDTSAMIQAERQAALGLIPALQILGTDLEELPVKAVTSSRSLMVAAGGLVGLLAGFWISQVTLISSTSSGRTSR